MENIAYIALSQQMALRTRMDQTANNVANVSTPGYKSYHTLLTEEIKKPESTQAMSMVMDYGQYRNTAQGPMTQTGNDLDFALRGQGYFTVLTDNGPRYTRDGHFTLNREGQIITASGDLVAGNGGGPITIPPEAKNITVGKDGSIQTDVGAIGQFAIVQFDDDQLLKSAGNNQYTADGVAAIADTETDVLQGMVEESNVQGVKEMTEMIDILRKYQSASRLIQTDHDRQSNAINILGSAN